MVKITRALAVAAVLALLAGCGSSSSTPLSDRQKDVRSQDSNVAMRACGTDCTGEIDGAKYAIVLPDKWNGTLLLYSHGYRFATPSPTDPTEQPSTAAQVSSTDDDGSGSDALSKRLLSEGYALAGSSYKTNGWAVSDGLAADVALHDKFVSLVGKPRRVYVWGDSLGGLITTVLAEQHPEWVDGAAPMCGAVAGPNLNFDAALDVAFAVKTLIYPAFKITGYASADEAGKQWQAAAAAVKKAAADVAGGGTAKLVYIGALVDAPSKTRTFDGANPTSQIKAVAESVLTALAFGTVGRYEVEQRVGGNPSSNSSADYASRISPGEAQLIKTVGGDPAKLTALLAAAAKVSADPAAREKFQALGDTTGKLAMPMLTMHTEADPLVIVQNESVLRDRATKSGDQELVQLYVAAPRTYDEKTGAPYGAGHCNFTDDQRVALLDTLDNWVRRSIYPVPVGVTSAFGDGLDPTYTPAPWPAATG